MTSNAPPHLRTELYVAHYTGWYASRHCCSAMRRLLVATRYVSRNLPESTVSDWSPSPWSLSRFPFNVGGGLHDRQAAITGSS
jgi:hypothetical protein